MTVEGISEERNESAVDLESNYVFVKERELVSKRAAARADLKDGLSIRSAAGFSDLGNDLTVGQEVLTELLAEGKTEHRHRILYSSDVTKIHF